MTVTRYDITEPPGPRMSRCVVNGGMVYLAGLTAGDTTADISGQTRQILDRIDAYLARASTDKSKLLTAQIWLTDIGNLAAMNAVWNAWVDPRNPPARATVEAQLARPELLVEIMGNRNDLTFSGHFGVSRPVCGRVYPRVTVDPRQ